MQAKLPDQKGMIKVLFAKEVEKRADAHRPTNVCCSNSCICNDPSKTAPLCRFFAIIYFFFFKLMQATYR